MIYHLKNWEYFIELSCIIPEEMIEILSGSLSSIRIGEAGRIGVTGKAFSRIIDKAKCVRTREGLETVILLILQDYIWNILITDPSILDRYLEDIDKQMEGLKLNWAEKHELMR